LRRFVEAAADLRRKSEVVFQMRDMFQEDDLVVKSNVIEQDQMLVQLAHVANVGNYRQAQLFRHQADSEKFAYTSEPGAICLYEMYASVMEEVLEKNAVRYVFARRNLYRGKGTR
jgi:hypothetical protein